MCLTFGNGRDSSAFIEIEKIINELRRGQFSKIAERAGREQDREGDGTLEKLRREGYM